MINIRGIIIPVNWDAKGNVIGMAIATHKEEEYFIEDDDKSTGLSSFLREEVEIQGILKTKDGRRIIQVKRFSKLKNRV